jgi:hypothetical protein
MTSIGKYFELNNKAMSFCSSASSYFLVCHPERSEGSETATKCSFNIGNHFCSIERRTMNRAWQQKLNRYSSACYKK